jgi:hypothetical protein
LIIVPKGLIVKKKSFQTLTFFTKITNTKLLNRYSGNYKLKQDFIFSQNPNMTIKAWSTDGLQEKNEKYITERTEREMER